jgi:hypothetical protein
MQMRRFIPNIYLHTLEIWKSHVVCAKCCNKTLVFAIARQKRNEDEAYSEPCAREFFVRIKNMSSEAEVMLSTITASYYRDWDHTSGERFYMNHCEHCGVPLTDGKIILSPESPFWGSNDRDLGVSIPMLVEIETESVY